MSSADSPTEYPLYPPPAAAVDAIFGGLRSAQADCQQQGEERTAHGIRDRKEMLL